MKIVEEVIFEKISKYNVSYLYHSSFTIGAVRLNLKCASYFLWNYQTLEEDEEEKKDTLLHILRNINPKYVSSNV